MKRGEYKGEKERCNAEECMFIPTPGFMVSLMSTSLFLLSEAAIACVGVGFG